MSAAPEGLSRDDWVQQVAEYLAECHEDPIDAVYMGWADNLALDYYDDMIPGDYFTPVQAVDRDLGTDF